MSGICSRHITDYKDRRNIIKYDITGQKFGELIANFHTGKNLWNVTCSCGTNKVVSGADLRRGRIKSCGCKKRIDLTGQQFGELTAVSYVGKAKWLVRCSCGNERIIQGGSLRAGRSRSCGCMRGICRP